MSDFSELAQLKVQMLENFKELFLHAAEDSTLRLCEIADYASELARFLVSLMQMEVDSSDGLLLLKDGISEFFAMRSEFEQDLPVNREEILWQLDRFCKGDAALLVKLFLEKLSSLDIRLYEEDFAHTDDVPPIYAYVKNTLSDEAFDVITENLPDARVRYITSFAEGARLLLSGEVGYCLFPIEEKGGMRLPTVENLLKTKMLCIHRIVPVFGFDGLADLKYALVSRGVRVEPYREEDDRYFEFSFEEGEESPSLSELLSAIDLFGLTLYRIHSIASEGDEKGNSYTLVVRSQGVDFLPLIIYLTLFFDTHRIIGIYKNLES